MKTQSTILVTGAGGFIGSHLVETLLARGEKVRALVHYNALGSSGWLSPRVGLEIVYADLRDRGEAQALVSGMQTVFHLGALIAIPYSYEAPESYVETNVLGTLNILQACREHKVKRMVHTSSSEVYGSALYAPMDESHPLQAQSPYAATKIAADKLVESFHRSFGLPVVTVRPFNTFGPRQSTRAVIASTISQLLKGTELKVGNLYPTRDFNYVTNTVEGFLAAATAPCVDGEVFNIGSGEETSIGDLMRLIAKIMGKGALVELDALRERPSGSEVTRLKADARKARKLLGWHPSIGLEEGLRKTIAWHQMDIVLPRTPHPSQPLDPGPKSAQP